MNEIWERGDGVELKELALACPRPSGTSSVVASHLNAAENKWRNLSCVLNYKFCVHKNNPDKNLLRERKRERKNYQSHTHK